MEEVLSAYLRCEGPSSEEFLSTRVEFPSCKYATAPTNSFHSPRLEKIVEKEIAENVTDYYNPIQTN